MINIKRFIPCVFAVLALMAPVAVEAADGRVITESLSGPPLVSPDIERLAPIMSEDDVGPVCELEPEIACCLDDDEDEVMDDPISLVTDYYVWCCTDVECIKMLNSWCDHLGTPYSSQSACEAACP